MQLDEILKLPQDTAGELLIEWSDDSWNDGPVLVKSNDGKPMQVAFGNRWLTIPPKGRRVNRTAAVGLVQDYGKFGKYYQMDQASGLRKSEWRSMAPKQKEMYASFEFNFRDQYLTHIPGPFDEDSFDALYEAPTPSPFEDEDDDITDE